MYIKRAKANSKERPLTDIAITRGSSSKPGFTRKGFTACGMPANCNQGTRSSAPELYLSYQKAELPPKPIPHAVNGTYYTTGFGKLELYAVGAFDPCHRVEATYVLYQLALDAVHFFA